MLLSIFQRRLTATRNCAGKFSFFAPGSLSCARCPSVSSSASRYTRCLLIDPIDRFNQFVLNSPGGSGVRASGYFPFRTTDAGRCKGTRCGLIVYQSQLAGANWILNFPGIFFILPCVDAYARVDLRTRTYDVPPQEVSRCMCLVILRKV